MRTKQYLQILQSRGRFPQASSLEQRQLKCEIKRLLEPSGAESGLHVILNLGIGHLGTAGHATRMGFMSFHFLKGHFSKDVETNAPGKLLITLFSSDWVKHPVVRIKKTSCPLYPLLLPVSPCKALAKIEIFNTAHMSNRSQIMHWRTILPHPPPNLMQKNLLQKKSYMYIILRVSLCCNKQNRLIIVHFL